MAGVGKEIKGAAKKAAKGKGTGGKNKGGGGGSGAAKAKNTAKRLLK